MQIGQFWRLLNFMQFCDFIATKDSSYVTQNLWKPQDKGKKKWLVYSRPSTAHYWDINFFVALYYTLLNTFLSLLLHTKSSSALDCMHTSPSQVGSCVRACEPWKWFWFVQVKKLIVFYSCLRYLTRMTSLKAAVCITYAKKCAWYITSVIYWILLHHHIRQA